MTNYGTVQARTKLFEKGGADFAPGPYAALFIFCNRSAASLESHCDAIFQTRGRGIFRTSPTSITSTKATTTKAQKITSKRGVQSHPLHPPPSDGPAQSHRHIKLSSKSHARKFLWKEWYVATSWQLRGVCGNIRVYVALTVRLSAMYIS